MWVFRSLSLLLGTLILFFIVKRAHTTIKRQRQQLHQQLLDTERLAEQNGLLRATADDSRRKAARANEELLSRVGAEIHDGPIQLLSVAMLGLNNFPARAPLPAANGTVALSSPDTLVGEVIDHLRTISTGLILPEIEHLAPREVIMLAVAGHERAAGTSVETNVSALPTQISQGLKACIYRIVQECLNNSARHAEGKGMKVAAWHDGSAITLVVSDRGPGFRPSEGNDQRPRLGLLGAKNRVVAFGGTLRIDETIGGVKVTAVLPIDSDEIVAGMPSG
jgi:signal transduction histidine kinase